MAATLNAPLYTTEILRLAAEMPEPRTLESEDGCAELRSATCGSVVGVAVQLDDDERVQGLSLRVQACAFGQASAAILERGARGRHRDEVAKALASLASWLDGAIEAADFWPGIAALAPARPRKSRHAAILLPFRALMAALEEARR